MPNVRNTVDLMGADEEGNELLKESSFSSDLFDVKSQAASCFFEEQTNGHANPSNFSPASPLRLQAIDFSEPEPITAGEEQLFTPF